MTILTQKRSIEQNNDSSKDNFLPKIKISSPKSILIEAIGMIYSSYVLSLIFAATVIRVANSTILSVASEGVLHDLKVIQQILLITFQVI